MEKSSRKILIQKNPTDNWNIGLLKSVFKCIKCKKYNSIIKHNQDTNNYKNNNYNKVQNCQYCSNPNYINR